MTRKILSILAIAGLTVFTVNASSYGEIEYDGSVKISAKDITENTESIRVLNEKINEIYNIANEAGYQEAVSKHTGGNALPGEVLFGKEVFINGEKVTGTMPNNGKVTPSALPHSGSYTIPEGYHNGEGVVTAKTLKEQTGVDNGKTAITAAAILSNYQGWVNGEKVTGTIPQLNDLDFSGEHSNTTKGQSSVYSVKADIDGYVSKDTVVKEISSGTTSIETTEASGVVVHDLIPGYYHNISVDQTPAYKQGYNFAYSELQFELVDNGNGTHKLLITDEREEQ